jgi:hypothetical protein
MMSVLPVRFDDVGSARASAADGSTCPKKDLVPAPGLVPADLFEKGLKRAPV